MRYVQALPNFVKHYIAAAMPAREARAPLEKCARLCLLLGGKHGGTDYLALPLLRGMEKRRKESMRTRLPSIYES